MTDVYLESETAYRNGYEAGQEKRDKLSNENRDLRAANKELFDELARIKRDYKKVTRCEDCESWDESVGAFGFGKCQHMKGSTHRDQWCCYGGEK